MDEDEYEDYLDDMDFLAYGSHRVEDPDEAELVEKLRDEDHEIIPGCYRVRPASTDA
jgi:hypothetical protein